MQHVHMIGLAYSYFNHNFVPVKVDSETAFTKEILVVSQLSRKCRLQERKYMNPVW